MNNNTFDDNYNDSRGEENGETVVERGGSIREL